MVSASPPLESFYGRTTELGMVKRLIEQRVGAQIGFRGIGGIGKSTLLAQIAAEARRLAVTPYIVSIALDEQMTPVGFYRKLLDGLRATGKTTRRRALLFSEDALRPCETLLRRLEQQEVWLQKKVQNEVIATGGGRIGSVTVELHEQGGVATTVLMRDLHQAFVELVTRRLPETVTVPPGVTDYLPHRLLILLVDNLERARPDVLEELRRLRSGSLHERVLLICAGRPEDHTATNTVPHLLTCDLDRLDEASCRAWLTRAAVTDQALREAILRLCQGVPLLLRLCLHEVEQARAQGETPGAADFALPPQPGGEASLHVVEAFLVERFIERLERGGEAGERLSRLVRFGCVLPNFTDRDAIRALQIAGLPDDLDPLIRALREQGMMSGAELHPVIRQAALTRLAQCEPQHFRDSCERAAAYYTGAGRLVEALTIRLQAGEAISDEEFAQQVAAVARAGDLALARRLVAVVERFAPQRAELAWVAALARIDMARATGKRDAAEAELARAAAIAGEEPERVAALEERVRTLEKEQPLRDGMLLLWWLPRQPDSPDVLQRLLELGEAFRLIDEYAASTALLRQALAMAQRLDDRQGAAHALLSLGEALWWQAEVTAAQGYYQQALEMYQSIGDRRGAAHALRGLGDALLQQAEVTAAQGYYQQALEMYQSIGDRLGAANALRGLGDALRRQAEVTAAQGYYQQALEMYQSIGDRLGAANALLGLGAALRLQGDRQQAEERLEEALAIGRQIQYRAAQFNALRTLIALAEEAGDHRSAADYRLEYQRLLVEKR